MEKKKKNEKKKKKEEKKKKTLKTVINNKVYIKLTNQLNIHNTPKHSKDMEGEGWKAKKARKYSFPPPHISKKNKQDRKTPTRQGQCSKKLIKKSINRNLKLCLPFVLDYRNVKQTLKSFMNF